MTLSYGFGSQSEPRYQEENNPSLCSWPNRGTGYHTDYNEGVVLGAAIDRGLTVTGTARDAYHQKTGISAEMFVCSIGNGVRLTSSPDVRGSIFRRERANDFLEALVAAERV